MKKMSFLLPVAAIAVALLAAPSFGAITGSAHDFGGEEWANDQVCLPCHIPHNAKVKDTDGTVLGGPLWNHTLSQATYTLYYDQETQQAVTGQVDTNSMLCLSCHDGTLALDSFGGGSATGAKIRGTDGNIGSPNVGTDLSNDHPIGEAAVWHEVPYMVSQADRDAAHIMPLRKLPDGRDAVGCTSCHEPHNRKNTENMLWASVKGTGTTVDGRTVAGSTLCFNCHKK